MTEHWRRVPDPPLDPPEYPEPPEAEGKCDLCGKEDWGQSEVDNDMAKAPCQTMVQCPTCKGTGKATTDWDELIALILCGKDKCEECDGDGRVLCEGVWEKYVGPPDPPERDDD